MINNVKLIIMFNHGKLTITSDAHVENKRNIPTP
jgi:hypothetical protein